MSPEQARGDNQHLDLRSDVFGLGAILCEILTGQPPFVGADQCETIRQAARGELTAAFERLDCCGTDRALIALAKQCLEPEPAARPQDAGELSQRFTAYLESVLKQAERDLIRFFELSLDLFCIAGFDGFFHRVNANFSRVLGHTTKELLAHPFLDFVHPDDHQATRDAMAIVVRGVPVVQFRNRYRDHSGNYRWFEWTGKSIPEEKVIFAVARDVTDSVNRSR
jgi:serine/threonine-protein kinase